METMENEKTGRCIIVKGLENLNSNGCRFFIGAGPNTDTLMSSTRLRWLSHRENNGNCFTDEQMEAIDKINRIAGGRNEDAPFLRLKLLLYTHPNELKEEEARIIKQIIKCGGTDVRYLRSNKDHKLRISIQGTELFLSMSEYQEQEVHEGILYATEDENSLLLNYFEEQFMNEFKCARRLKLNNEKIVFADNLFTQLKKLYKSERGATVVWSIICIIVTLVITFLFAK